ncbi:MAG TPA: DUF742 domain-containing protein [Actinomycetes bacterium]|jgi:hypothetical protein|nr:DUF742 domain-containing protein [Actinomycetes bacterium]
MTSDDGTYEGAYGQESHPQDPYDQGGYDRGGGNRVVPMYAFTRGRTRSAGQELPIEALVTATDVALQREHDPSLQVEWRAIIAMCTRPMSVAEIGIGLRVPITVARVLVGDLANAGYLTVHMPRSAVSDSGPGQAILGRLIDGLRAR